MSRQGFVFDQGEGFPDVGDLVTGYDGNIYRIEAFHDDGQTRRILAKATLALVDPDTVEGEYDVFPARCEFPGRLA